MTSPTDTSYFSQAKTWVATSRVAVKFDKTWTDVKNYEYKNSVTNLAKRVNDVAPFLAIATTAVVLYNQPTSNFGVVSGLSFVATLLVPEIANRVVDKVKELWNKASRFELAGIAAVGAVVILPVTLPKAGAAILGAWAAKSVPKAAAIILGTWASKSIQDRPATEKSAS